MKKLYVKNKNFTLVEVAKINFPSPTTFFGRRGKNCLARYEFSNSGEVTEQSRKVVRITKPLTLFSDFRVPLKSKTVISPLGRGRKFGFTLAEVLITLGIIGVVATITMLTLIKNYQKHETVNRLKQTYNIIYNAVRMSETENGLLETWEIPYTSSTSANDCYNKGKIFFEQYLKPYIKTVKDCTTSECWVGSYTRTNGEVVNLENNKRYNIILANGTVIGFEPKGTFVHLYIDLNGKKAPNKYGRDFFDILISKKASNASIGNYNKSGVYMFGQGKDRISLTSGDCSCSKDTAGSNGLYCGALIMLDGWKIAPDYPW